MDKYALIRQKRDEAIAKRTERKNRRTFQPSIFQLNPIIAPDIVEPVDITPDIVEPVDIIPDIVVCISEANQPYEVEPILLIEKQTELENVLIENSIEDPIEEIPDIINPTLIAQAEELRKLILLQETIKRFSKKKSNIDIYKKNAS